MNMAVHSTDNVVDLDQIFREYPEIEAWYSPAWTADIELAIIEVGAVPASSLIDPGHAWSRCRNCGRERRMGYCRPLSMRGEDTCEACR